MRVNLGTDERTARVEHARLVLERERGNLEVVPGASMEAYANRWLASLDAAPGARAQTLQTARSRVRHILRYFQRGPIQHVRASEVRAFLDHLAETGRAPATVAGVWAALRAILRLAARDGVIQSVPDPGRVHGSPPREHRIPLEVAEQVIAALPDDWRDGGELVLLTGLRLGELRGLTAADVDLAAGVVRVERTAVAGGVNPPKSRAGRRAVPLSVRARGILNARMAAHPEGPLWPGDAHGAGDAMRAALKAAGAYTRGRGWHTLRNVHVALLEQGGLSLREAAARVGHGAHTAQTMAYGWAAEAGEAGWLDGLRHAASPGGPALAPPPGGTTPGEAPGPRPVS